MLSKRGKKASDLISHLFSSADPIQPAPKNNTSTLKPAQPELFGSFSDLFITDQDIKTASEKLDLEKTRSIIINEWCDLLLSFQAHESEYMTSINTNLIFNHVLLGTGTLNVTKNGVFYKGSLIDDKFPMIELGFFYKDISNVYNKQIDNENVLFMTINDAIFVQFSNVDCELVLKQMNLYNKDRRECLLVNENKDEGANENDKIINETIVHVNTDELILKAIEKRDKAILLANETFEIELKMITDFQTCTICYTNIESVVLKCGHLICGECRDKIEVCPWDRNPLV